MHHDGNVLAPAFVRCIVRLVAIEAAYPAIEETEMVAIWLGRFVIRGRYNASNQSFVEVTGSRLVKEVQVLLNHCIGEFLLVHVV